MGNRSTLVPTNLARSKVSPLGGERLADLLVRIAQMIFYQAYNIKSPLNAHAAMWADLNLESLLVDSRDLYPPVLEQTAGMI
jgi:hypothetical protein